MGMVERMANSEEVSVGGRWRRWRCDRGWTMAQCAEACGVSPPSICRIENGQQELRHRDLEAFCAALGIDVLAFYAYLPPEVGAGEDVGAGG